MRARKATFLGAMASVLLAVAPSASAATVPSMLPAVPLELHRNDGACTPTDYYFMAVVFEWAEDSPKMMRVAEQAARTYATPADLLTLDHGFRYLRVIEVKDVLGLLKFLASLREDEDMKVDLMVQATPKEQRFASADEQVSMAYEFYISELAETNGISCGAGL